MDTQQSSGTPQVGGFLTDPTLSPATPPAGGCCGEPAQNTAETGTEASGCCGEPAVSSSCGCSS